MNSSFSASAKSEFCLYITEVYIYIPLLYINKIFCIYRHSVTSRRKCNLFKLWTYAYFMP